MDNFDAFRAITRRYFWDDYRSCLTCLALPIFSGSSFASGETMDVGIDPIFQAAGPTFVSAVRSGETVTLSWTAIPNGFAYVVYSSNVEAGPFSVVAAGIQGLSFDFSAPEGTFLRVTGIESSFGETLPSPTISV